VAALGALLALILGVSRTGFAMARDGFFPRALTAVHPRHGVPHRAELAVGLLVAVLVATVDLRGAIGFSSFGVLLYYAVANVSAFTLPDRSKVVPVAGLAGCLLLAATLPWHSSLAGLVVVLAGVAWYMYSVRR
jgi:APA family basic amino acid/polyamine antiporter